MEQLENKSMISVANKRIQTWKDYKNNTWVAPPEDYSLQKTTVWSFPDRGEWATHTPQYRGNWSPHIVRNLIELYSKVGDTILDPMAGGGTTPVECILLNRNSISVDINPDAISIIKDRTNFSRDLVDGIIPTYHRTKLGDTRNLSFIPDNSIDLILAHPPYANMIKYTNGKPGDLSQIDDFNQFFVEYDKAISEYYRLLKNNKYCAVMMGDTHRKGHYVPFTTKLMLNFLKKGFVLKEDIVKVEWNCESSIKKKKIFL